MARDQHHILQKRTGSCHFRSRRQLDSWALAPPGRAGTRLEPPWRFLPPAYSLRRRLGEKEPVMSHSWKSVQQWHHTRSGTGLRHCRPPRSKYVACTASVHPSTTVADLPWVDDIARDFCIQLLLLSIWNQLLRETVHSNHVTFTLNFLTAVGKPEDNTLLLLTLVPFCPAGNLCTILRQSCSGDSFSAQGYLAQLGHGRQSHHVPYDAAYCTCQWAGRGFMVIKCTN